jgi:hypothetical protein
MKCCSDLLIFVIKIYVTENKGFITEWKWNWNWNAFVIYGIFCWLSVQYVKVKVKVKSSLCLTKHHAMKTYWGVDV